MSIVCSDLSAVGRDVPVHLLPVLIISVPIIIGGRTVLHDSSSSNAQLQNSREQQCLGPGNVCRARRNCPINGRDSSR